MSDLYANAVFSRVYDLLKKGKITETEFYRRCAAIGIGAGQATYFAGRVAAQRVHGDGDLAPTPDPEDDDAR